MSYPRVALAEFCETQYGFTSKSSEIATGPRYLRIMDTVPEIIDWDSVPRAVDNPVDSERFLLKEGDIVVARTGAGSAGKGRYIREAPDDTIFASFLVRLRVASPNDARYIGYLIESSEFEQWARASAGGTSRPSISAKLMSQYEVPLPPPSEQGRIAALLSTFDDLIADNTRRIEILEEMARAIYREWFVEFRYPGHEGVPLVESELGPIPEGWSVVGIGDALDTLESGSRPRGGAIASGIPSIGAENVLGPGRHDYSKEKFVSEDFFDTLKRGKVEPGDVLLYKDGAYIGRTSITGVDFPHVRAAINEHVLRMRSDLALGPEYLYFHISHPSVNTRIVALNSNAAQPGISQSKLKGLPIMKPLPNSIAEFSGPVRPLLDLLFNLAKQNRHLTATRDLLLPKLVSGEIDVSNLDLGDVT